MKYTLCKHCDSGCKDYEYIRFGKNGNLYCFQYCKGGAEEVKKSEWFIQKDGYAESTRKINGKKRMYHTLFKKDPNLVIDHIDGDRLDNRLRMLREVTFSDNSQNFHWEDRRVTSRFPGVYYDRKNRRWRAVAKRFRSGHPQHKVIARTGFSTQLEAFDFYVKSVKELGRSVNTETAQYREYLRWKSERSQVSLDEFEGTL